MYLSISQTRCHDNTQQLIFGSNESVLGMQYKH